MRSTNTPRADILNRFNRVFTRIVINNQDLTGRAKRVELSTDVDSKGWVCSLDFTNHPSQDDLRPGSGSIYNDTLKPNKPVKVYMLVGSDTSYPDPSDSRWDLVFDGLTGDEVICERRADMGDTVSIRCRGRIQKRLQDRFIMDELVYPIAARGAEVWRVGNKDAYESATVVAQQILDEEFGQGAITLRVVHDPNYTVYPYKVSEISVWDALQKLFFATGYDLREKYYEATGAFELVLSDPLVVGGTETLSDYKQTTLNYSDANVRNIIRVIYRSRDPDADIALGAVPVPGAPRGVLFVERSDASSINEYGPRRMKIVEDETSLIDTYQEAYDLAGYILNDLKDIAPTDQVVAPGALYFIEPYDVITLAASQGGDIAVTGISISVEAGGVARTTLRGVRRGVVREIENHLRRDPRTRPGGDDKSDQTDQRVGVGDDAAPATPEGVTAHGGIGEVIIEFNPVTVNERGKPLESFARYFVYAASSLTPGIPDIDIADETTYHVKHLADMTPVRLPVETIYSGGSTAVPYMAVRLTAIDRAGRESIPSEQVEEKPRVGKTTSIIDSGFIVDPDTEYTEVWSGRSFTIPEGYRWVVIAIAGELMGFTDWFLWLDTNDIQINHMGSFWPGYGNELYSVLEAGTYTNVYLYIHHFLKFKGVLDPDFTYDARSYHQWKSGGYLDMAGEVSEGIGTANKTINEVTILYEDTFWMVLEVPVG